MLENASDLRISEPDTALIGKLAVAEKLLLGSAMAVAALNLFGWLAPLRSGFFPGGWRPMSPEAAVATLLSAASFYWSHPRYGHRVRVVGAALATLVAIGSAAVFAMDPVRATPALASGILVWVTKGMAPQAAACFVLTSIAILFIQARRGIIGWTADFFAFCLFFAVALEGSGQIIGRLRFFGPVVTFAMAAQTLFCLLLLAAVIFIRRAEYGVFSILLGRGIGSKVARVLTPLLIVLPYVREGVRAHIIDMRHMPPHYTTALLATAAVAISISLLTYLAWRLNGLEAQIHALSLRDPLTDLYNLRGFQLLADQALLLAHRSAEPFSVLFIDVDNLKQINDALGHQTGSEFLTATANILRQTFRETDVLGRIGGDEFVVAGLFNRARITDAAQRLRLAAAQHSASGVPAPLNFSIGWATCRADKREPLADLLAKADIEMYRDKRLRKSAAAGDGKHLLKSDLTPGTPSAPNTPDCVAEFGSN